MTKVDQAREMSQQGLTPVEIAKKLKESPFLVTQWVKKKENKNGKR